MKAESTSEFKKEHQAGRQAGRQAPPSSYSSTPCGCVLAAMHALGGRAGNKKTAARTGNKKTATRTGNKKAAATHRSRLAGTRQADVGEGHAGGVE